MVFFFIIFFRENLNLKTLLGMFLIQSLSAIVPNQNVSYTINISQ
jgi:uncharacterized membrane protein